jgi:hypothetical protein
MPWMVPAAIGGAAVVGAASSNKASNAAQAGTKEGIKASQYGSDRARNDLQPWTNAGTNALNSYQQAIGQGGSYANTPMSWDSYIESDIVPKKNRKEAYEGYLSRFDQGEWIPDGGSASGPGIYDDFEGGQRFEWNADEIYDDPGYNFVRDEALRATTRQENAGGNEFSGNILAALQDRGAGLAASYSNQFRGNALNESNVNYGRDLGEWDVNQRGKNTDLYGRDQNYLSRLQGLSQGGQNAAARQGGYSQNAGNAQGGFAQAGGNADAAQYQGYNNALQGTISNYLGYDAMKNSPYGNYGRGGNWMNSDPSGLGGAPINPNDPTNYYGAYQ